MRASTTHYDPEAAPLARPTIVTRKGQITIPAPIRDALGIKKGDTVTVALTGDEITLQPVSSSLAAGYQSIPALPTPKRWQEVLHIAHDDHAEEVMLEG